MAFHKDLIGNDLHIARTQVGLVDPNSVITAGIIGQQFWDSVAKKFYIAEDTTDSDWFNSSSPFDTLLELNDVDPSSFVGQAGKVFQVNAAELGMEFGQPLRPTDDATFNQVTVGGTGLVVGTSTPFSDTAGVLTLQNIDVLEATAKSTIENAIGTLANLTSVQGQTLTLSGSLIVESASILNQDLTTDANPQFNNLSLGGNLTLTGTVDGIDVGVAVPLNTTHGASDGKDHADVVLNNTHRSSSGDDHTFIDQDVTTTGTPAFLNLTAGVIKIQGNQITSTGLNESIFIIPTGTGDLVVTTGLSVLGDLTVQGTTTTLDSVTLLIEDKNIELGVVTTPTDITADGGGITLKGTTDKTINWINATDRWTFNQGIDLLDNTLVTTGIVAPDILIAATSAFAGNLSLSGNTLSSTNANGDIILSPNGTGNVSIASNAIIGSTSVSPDGTLHVHTGSAGGVTASSAANGFVVEDSKDTGVSVLTPDASFGRFIFATPSDNFGAFLAWNFSFSDFAVGTSKVGANFRLLSDQETTNLTLSGGLGSELATFAKDATINGQIKIAGGNPGNNKFLRSDANGLATWGEVGWTDLGTDVVLLNGNDSVGIGAIPDASAKLEVASTTKGVLGTRGTTTQIDAIVSPATGLESYDTTVNKKKVFTGSEFKTFLTEDVGQVVVQETFASTNARFFGELGLPSAQGWTDTATGIATIDLVTQTVFGVVKQVVRHNDDTGGGSTTSKINLTTQNWIDINTFGDASFGGVSRLDTVNGGSGFFSGLQANAAENPLATGNRRYGILFDNNAGNIRLIEADNTGNNVTMDGTNGNPLVVFDEWFSRECIVPAGLGAAEVFINGILTTFVPTFFINGGGLGTQVIVSSGSTGGSNRISYHDNFGTTIFEESATKTLTAVTMDADVAQITIPEGRRDYTIILPDGNPRPIGAALRLAVNNLFGTVTLQNQTPAAPEALFNGLAEITFTVFSKEIVGGINTVDQGNVYIGFKAEDVSRASAIFAQLHSIIDQTPTDTNPTIITYTNHDAINGIGHSTTLNTGELEILPGLAGTYSLLSQPQVGKDSGGTKVDFDMFLQVDSGSGFVDEPNSNAKLTIKDSDITDVVMSVINIQLQVGDKIRMMQRVSNAAVGMGLKNTDAVVGPPTLPRTPSIIFSMVRIGGI